MGECRSLVWISWPERLWLHDKATPMVWIAIGERSAGGLLTPVPHLM